MMYDCLADVRACNYNFSYSPHNYAVNNQNIFLAYFVLEIMK